MVGMYIAAAFSAIVSFTCGINAGSFACIKDNSTINPKFTEFFARQLTAGAWLFGILTVVFCVFADWL